MSCKYHFNWTTDTPCPYCRIEELEQQLADEKKAAGYWMEQSCKDHNRAEKAEQQLSRYQSKYHNLLAVAHRDGGQYLAQHGEEKAGEDAITAILAAYHNNDSYQGGVEVEGVISEFGDILLTEPSPIDIGQRVCALVKEVE